MSIVIEATYENGVLKPAKPLPLQERERVRITIARDPAVSGSHRVIIPCDDPVLIEQVAMDRDLEYTTPEAL